MRCLSWDPASHSLRENGLWWGDKPRFLCSHWNDKEICILAYCSPFLRPACITAASWSCFKVCKIFILCYNIPNILWCSFMFQLLPQSFPPTDQYSKLVPQVPARPWIVITVDWMIFDKYQFQWKASYDWLSYCGMQYNLKVQVRCIYKIWARGGEVNYYGLLTSVSCQPTPFCL